MISSTVEILGNLFIALFSITFITFFFLQDQGILTESIVILSPKRYGKAVRHALASIKRLLIRYFIGIGGQLTGILLLVTIGMTIIGLDFKQSLLIGLTAAVVNIIPYLGPLIGSGLGILMGLAFHIDMGIVNLLPMVGYMTIVYLIVHAIDNFIFQPFIFGNRVYAHPLEIFLVIMMAGSIGGVTGMIVAIPAYTILRVFAKEFFNNFRVVKKLTEKI
jgi:predicted PurR-regulated permease PerM